MTVEEKEQRKQERKQNYYNNTHKIIDGILHKLCNKHHIYFPEENEFLPLTSDYFYNNNSNNIDGYNPYCINCTIEKMYEWRINNLDYLEKENKRTNNRYHNETDYKQMIIDSSNKRRKNGKYLEWQRTEEGKESFKKSNKKRKERTHIIIEQEWESDKKYFNHRCAYCGLPIEEHWITYAGKRMLGDFHKEHVIHTGKNDLANCVPSCESCNTSKHEKTLNEWYNENNPNYTYERYYKIYMWLRYDYKKYIMPKKRYKGQSLKARLKEIEKSKGII